MIKIETISKNDLAFDILQSDVLFYNENHQKIMYYTLAFINGEIKVTYTIGGALIGDSVYAKDKHKRYDKLSEAVEVYNALK